jgi:hypothetical protein
MRAHTPCERRGGQARQSTCRPHIRPSKNTHTHTHAHTCAYAFSLQRHASAQPTSSIESNHMHPATVTDVHQSAYAQHTEEASHVCMCPHLCTTSTHKKVHSRPFIAYTHHTQITPLAPHATHSALPTGQHVPWTGEGRRFGCRHTSASAWPTQRSPRSLWMV